MSRPIIFGEIPGIAEGTAFKGRKEMMPSSFHRNWGAGIDGNGKEGTSAIVLSGGYEDDLDLGDEIVYTGAGGNDPNSGRQVEDQSWNNRGNAGLVTSRDKGLPVRVIRGHTHKSTFSPKTGYLYGGIYSVVDAWEEVGKSGFKICRFRLMYSGGNTNRRLAEEIETGDEDDKPTVRREGTILRIIRDTKMARLVKELYNHECQVCSFTIDGKKSRYAEGAHIKGLGKPHSGSDTMNNIICLCPNHHVMFDKGLFCINNDFTLLGQLSGKLVVKPQHKLKISNLEYHRKCHGYS